LRTMNPIVNLRLASLDDEAAIWEILQPVLRAGDTYAIDTDIGRTAALVWWFRGDHEVWAAEVAGVVVGSYYLQANQEGPGSHVANCGYITAVGATGQGVATAMCQQSLRRAAERGFHSMQFNLVVSSNTRAVALWHRLGFTTVGTIPDAFDHPDLGLVPAFVMYRPLAA